MSCQLQNVGIIFLIGYRCTGKSSVGELLAARLGRRFVDTDSVVVVQAGKSIQEIVVHSGWEEFRRLERAVLQQAGALDRPVVATGGGIVLDVANIEKMKAGGTVVWLRAAVDTIGTRMQQDQASEAFRPALNGRDPIGEIEATLAQREPLYRNAMDFAVDTDHHDFEQVCETIITKLEKWRERI